jgi:hypothetical protein
MKLKKYNDFIKESFGTSAEYNNFLKSKSIDLDLFDDSLFDVKQFAKVRTYRYLVDSKGHTINTDVDDNEKYKMFYVCQIEYNLVPGKNDFNKTLDNLNNIKISLEEMIDRVEAEGLKIDKNEYWNTTVPMQNREEITHTFHITFLSDEINTEELKNKFDIYNTTQANEYLEGLKKLRKIYRENGIDFDRYMDTTDDEEYIYIGIFIDDLFVVGVYNTETKQFSIDEDEVLDSIDAYNESEIDVEGTAFGR